ncbi:MAG: hypothetical protein J6L62_07985 [Clostridia bacterium]|nr:hypothetical protein [Clostridia bacterium]
MHNFEDIIEKYKRELVEFSKQLPIHTPIEEEYREAVSTAAQPQQEESRSFRADEPETVITPAVSFADYDDFLANNPSQGILRVQVFAADRSFPISGASVRVFVRLNDGERELFSGVSDADGVADGIILPAPDSSVSFDENSTVAPYAVYSLRVNRQNYAPASFDGIPVFDSVKSIQPVELIPLSMNGSTPDTDTVRNESTTLFGGVV